MRALLKLAQIGGVAGCHHRHIRKALAGDGGDQPEMMAVDDIGFKSLDRVGDSLREF